MGRFPQNALAHVSAFVSRGASLVMADLIPCLCLACHRRLITGALCAACKRSLSHTYQLDPEHRHALGAGVAAALNYQGLMREWMLAYKFGGQQAHARAFIELCADPLVEILSNALAGEALLVPIPCHHLRYVERGFHHTALLARLLQRQIGSQAKLALCTNSLAETASHRHASRMNRRDREHYALGRFYVPSPAKVAGRTIVLFDDIVTTGATMQAAKEALLSAGAREVICLAVCAKRGTLN